MPAMSIPSLPPLLSEPDSTARFINPPGLYDPRPNGYSHVVIAPADARMVYVAGQGGERPDGSLPTGFGEQVAQALRNMQLALAAADADVSHVLRLCVLVVDHDESRLAVLSQALRTVWAQWELPACTLIPVPRLALDGMLFEVEATAAVPAPGMSAARDFA